MGCFVRGGISLWDVLSGVSKMAWDVLSRDVLSYIRYNYTQTALKTVAYSEAAGGISVLSRTIVNLTLLRD